MKKSLLTALGLAFALAVSMPLLGASNANAAMGQVPAATTATTTSPGSDAMVQLICAAEKQSDFLPP